MFALLVANWPFCINKFDKIADTRLDSSRYIHTGTLCTALYDAAINRPKKTPKLCLKRSQTRVHALSNDAMMLYLTIYETALLFLAASFILLQGHV